MQGVSPVSSNRTLFRVLAIVLALVATAAPLPAQNRPGDVPGRSRPPKGVKAGPWYLAPSLNSNWTVEDNVFRRIEETAGRALRSTGRLEAQLPFRNSLFLLDYSAGKSGYDLDDPDPEESIPRDLTTDLRARFDFRFSSGDELRVGRSYREEFTRGSAILDDSGLDASGNTEQTVGIPFQRDVWELRFERDLDGKHGYDLRIRQRTLEVDLGGLPQGINIGLVEEDGYEISASYRIPFSSNRSLVLYADHRRFDNFDPTVRSFFGTEELRRKELSDSYQLGLRGRLTRRWPYLFRLGYGVSRFEDQNEFVGIGSDGQGNPAPDFRPEADSRDTSVSGLVRLRFDLSPKTSVDTTLRRRLRPSDRSSFIVTDELSLGIQRNWSQKAQLSASLSAQNVVYQEDPVVLTDPDLIGQRACGASAVLGTGNRNDFRLRSNLQLSWRFHPRVAMRLQVDRDNRHSNCKNEQGRDIQAFNATTASAGVAIGWF